jgi:hypothetical protein
VNKISRRAFLGAAGATVATAVAVPLHPRVLQWFRYWFGPQPFDGIPLADLPRISYGDEVELIGAMPNTWYTLWEVDGPHGTGHMFDVCRTDEADRLLRLPRNYALKGRRGHVFTMDNGEIRPYVCMNGPFRYEHYSMGSNKVDILDGKMDWIPKAMSWPEADRLWWTQQKARIGKASAHSAQIEYENETVMVSEPQPPFSGSSERWTPVDGKEEKS